MKSLIFNDQIFNILSLLTKNKILWINFSNTIFLLYLNQIVEIIIGKSIIIRFNIFKMSIMDYNGSAMIAMKGKNCVAIAIELEI